MRVGFSMGAEPVTDPIELFLILLVSAVLLAVAGLRVMALYGEGSVGLTEAALYAVLVVAALGATLSRWGTMSALPVGAAFVMLCLGIPLVQRLIDHRLSRRLLRDDVAQCNRMLRFDPQNADAHSRLGDIYMRLGDLDTATQAYQRALELAPKDNIVQQALQRAIARKRQQVVDSKFCPRCRAENPRRAVYCRNCGTVLSAWAELRQGLQQMTPGMGLKWGAVVAGACLLLASAGIMLPRTAAMLVGASLALSAMVYLYVRALR